MKMNLMLATFALLVSAAASAQFGQPHHTPPAMPGMGGFPGSTGNIFAPGNGPGHGPGGFPGQGPQGGILCYEGQTCSVNGPSLIVYKSANGFGGGSSTPVWMTGSFGCNNNTFLRDPAPNIPKACFVIQQGPGPGGYDSEQLMDCAPEKGSCNLNGFANSQIIAYYGVPGNYTVKQVSGSFYCSNETFGVDPAYFNYGKRCLVKIGWTKCAEELPPSQQNQGYQPNICFIPGGGKATVRFGVPGRYVTRQVMGSIPCELKAFGNQDPAFGQVKSCEFKMQPY